jgi:hypothetical protein
MRRPPMQELLKNFPGGFALGDEHAPHMSVIGGHFCTVNLDELFAATGKVLASEKVMSWKLKAFKMATHLQHK